MKERDAIGDYLEEIENIRDDNATEFTYRTPLENLLRALNPKVGVVQEPSRRTGIGAPDFRISHETGAVIGYVECKKPGDNLHDLAKSAQVKKYKNLSPNILLTDYWNFYLLQDGASLPPVSLYDKTAKERQEAEDLLRRFLQSEPQKIGDSETLARALAERCRLLRVPLTENLSAENNRLRGIYAAFKETLYRDIDKPAFADALAQTLVYGLLTAKLNMKNGGALELHNVKKHIPQNFLLLREIAGFLDELDEPQYADIAYLVEDILKIINHMDAAAVNASMSYGGGKTDGDDPFLYFYEKFLAAYDAELREARGVYYTPPPVVRFIVRAADDILRRDFGLPAGLADKRVTALDFAAGTGTFMLEMFKLVFGDNAPARRDMLARKHLLKNFFGFELLLAPFAIAHLKLSQFLKDSGVPLGDNDRMNVFLTNTLEHLAETPELHFMPVLAAEAKRAQEIKERDILVITGNPPYSGESQNKNQFKDEIENYKYVDGEPLGEKNPKMLHDDYVKFIRFAQRKIDRAGEGVFAVITNHAFLDNPTFRGMRQSLMNSFDRLYFLDLHGSSKKQERAPDGGKDENVFSQIQQGVAISLFVKKKGLRKGVYRADLFGRRARKYKWCEEQRVNSVRWKSITPESPFYLFAPWNGKRFNAYRRHWQITDIFGVNSTGITTHRDQFAFAFARETICVRIADMARAELSDYEFQKKHNARETQDWTLADARIKIRAHQNTDAHIRLCSYRPFDSRWCFYGYETMDRPRPAVMRHMFAGDNLGLVTVRQVAESKFNHAFVSDNITDFRMTLSNRGGAFLFPLYRYDTEINSIVKRENFSPEFRRWINDRYGKKHSPEKILGCIYAILHSPDYRKRYGEFLRMDFPRIPFPKENAAFLRLAKIGGELIRAHLLQTELRGGAELCGEGVSHRVEKVHYAEKDGRLYFNKDEYFSPLPPEVFDFQIGGYKPLDKFLKSRKTRTLSGEEIETIERAAAAIAFTLQKQKEIERFHSRECKK